jgi:DNA-binding LytR/AlgR family response regulator
LNVVIVEDSAIVAEDIKDMLLDLGHKTVGLCNSAKETFQLIKTTRIDLILLDIRIIGEKSGIDIAKQLNEVHKIPFIFISAHSDKATIEAASSTAPFGYLVKPIRQESLYALLEVFKHNYKKEQSKSIKYKINQKGYSIEISVEDIEYLKAEGSYTNIKTSKAKYIVSKNLKQLLSLTEFESFRRIHRSYAVNPIYIIAESYKTVKLKDIALPIGREFK